MKPFKDHKGRVWELELSIGSVRRVRELANVNIYTLTENEAQSYVDLLRDLDKLATVVYCAIKPQADRLGVTGEEFADSLSRESIKAMRDAFVEEFIDFFPDTLRAKTLRVATEQARILTELHTKAGMGLLDAISASNKASMNLPATSESTPTRSRFASFFGWPKGKSAANGTRSPRSAP